MFRQRLDQALVSRGLAPTRSQAGSYIRLGQVTVNDEVATRPAQMVTNEARLHIAASERYVGRAGLKLASVADRMKLDFSNAVVLDVGSSTGGFTDFALQHGAAMVIAVEAGSRQLHASLRGNPRIELHEQTDIRDISRLSQTPDIVVIDVSFISLRQILPHISTLVTATTRIIAMVKPQFEAGQSGLKHKGVIKNEHIRRDVLKAFEQWVQGSFVVVAKVDSAVPGAKGNQERFYSLRVKPVPASGGRTAA